MRHRWWSTLGALVVAAGCAHGAGEPRPSVLLVISDDQRAGTVTPEWMPAVNERIFEAGVRFERAYVTTPLCCPSRSSIYTGMVARRHGVHRNEDPLGETTSLVHLHAAGYRVGFVGKYLNSWDGSPIAGADFYAAMLPEHMGSYRDPTLNVNGTVGRVPGYLTTILRDHALDFLDGALGRPEPFFLVFAPYAPHLPAEPAPEDAALYADLPPHRPPSFNEPDMTDKPRTLAEELPAAEDDVDAIRLAQLRTLRALDRAVAALLDRLAAAGRLSSTLVLYISDNGFLWGEHRITRKAQPYEEAIHVPFAIRWDEGVTAGVRTELVANIDIAPTLYELARVARPDRVQGLSLLALLRGERWRDRLLIEGWPTETRASWQAIHFGDRIYIRNEGDLDEYYDLDADPYQLSSTFGTFQRADGTLDPAVGEWRAWLDSFGY